MKRFVILDRDGVINQESVSYVTTEKEWVPEEGAIEAISMLTRAKIPVFVATNQSAIGRGIISDADLEKIHGKMTATVLAAGGHISDIKHCPHIPSESCNCRKPKPGLLNQIFNENKLKSSDGYFVGDSPTDIEAAKLAGCKPVLVLTGKGKQTLEIFPTHSLVFNNLKSFVISLLKQEL
ncbi:HAD-IIIA family hydrolase [Gammaproteobacteria bacterium]|nr:HAD-IIIA family hydrolase [Gammaproteobacteria bacterium]